MAKSKLKKPVGGRRVLRGSPESDEIERFEAAIRMSGTYEHDPEKNGCEDPNCPGWAVFSEYDTDPIFVLACDECDYMSDEEAAAAAREYGIETEMAPRNESAASSTLPMVTGFDRKRAYAMLFGQDAVLFQVIDRTFSPKHGFLLDQIVEGVGFACSPKYGLMVECFGEVGKGFVKKSQFVSFLNLVPVTEAAEMFLRDASAEVSEAEPGDLEKIGYSSLEGVRTFDRLN